MIEAVLACAFCFKQCSLRHVHLNTGRLTMWKEREIGKLQIIILAGTDRQDV
jgi:hypothetical protein